jgi:hypothetical protein
MTLLGETVSLLELNPEDWCDAPVRCISCGLYSDPQEMVGSVRGPVCKHCAGHGEAESSFDRAVKRKMASLKFIEIPKEGTDAR